MIVAPAIYRRLDFFLRNRRVGAAARGSFAARGAPEHIRSDNGPEFVAREVTRWLYRAKVHTLFIAKGSPWENGYVESFDSRFRDAWLCMEPCLAGGS